MEKAVIIGSRGSDLALWQAHFVQDELAKLGIKSEIKIITTKGDKIQHLSFDKIEGKGFFTKELEEALLSNEIDLAVHSHKDLETQHPEGLTIAAVSYREDPADILLIKKEAVDRTQKFNLKLNAVVGTSSARRKAQILFHRYDVALEDLRGNVPTRVNKLRTGNYDAILLAYAGLKRLNLNLEEFHLEVLNPLEFVPAAAQGVLALQTRIDDTTTIAAVSTLNNSQVQETIAVERTVLRKLEGGCKLPFGAYCTKEADTFVCHAFLAETWDAKGSYITLKNTSPLLLAETVFNTLTALKKK